MIQFDYPTIFFKMGWFNHQLDGYFCFCKDIFWETISVPAVCCCKLSHAFFFVGQDGLDATFTVTWMGGSGVPQGGPLLKHGVITSISGLRNG